ncbi:branched-chain amino acid ABC transporter permease [Candidatus Uhrbacteria bacterium]|nr:branched-chain amino acid ABC transporter permease [Candidatus Uhrbacteria bacterium]
MFDIFPQLVVNSLIAGSIYALLAVSFNFIFSATRFFNLAHGSFAVIAAYAVFYFGRELGLPTFLAVGIGVLFAATSAILIDRFIFHPLKMRGGSPMILLVASLGVFTVINSIISMIFGSSFKTISNTIDKQYFELFGAAFTSVQLWIFILSLVVSIGFFIILEKTIFGKVVAAVSDDEEVSKIVGIDTDKVMAKVFFIGGGIAGLGGILAGFDTGVQPSLDMFFLLKAVIAAIIGGIGNPYGALLGAYLIGFLENFGIWVIPSEWKDTIAFVLLIVFLIFRPSGILKRK